MPAVPEQARAAAAMSGKPEAANPSADALFDELKAISLWSAEWLGGDERLVEADLYDDDGLPA